MWLEALITLEDLKAAVDQLLPVHIDLSGEGTKERTLFLDRARDASLVAAVGLRLVCPAALTWEIAGLSPTVKLDELAVLLKPAIVDRKSGHALEFHFELEEADVRGLPSLIDGAIMRAVNGALVEQKLTWDITDTLSRTVPIGAAMKEVRALKIGVNWAKARITSEALALAISFDMTFARSD